MATPAANTPIAPGPGLGGPGEPVPVAFVGRTSTLELQDPVASLRRQVRASQAALLSALTSFFTASIRNGMVAAPSPLISRSTSAKR